MSLPACCFSMFLHLLTSTTCITLLTSWVLHPLLIGSSSSSSSAWRSYGCFSSRCIGSSKSSTLSAAKAASWLWDFPPKAKAVILSGWSDVKSQHDNTRRDWFHRNTMMSFPQSCFTKHRFRKTKCVYQVSSPKGAHPFRRQPIKCSHKSILST